MNRSCYEQAAERIGNICLLSCQILRCFLTCGFKKEKLVKFDKNVVKKRKILYPVNKRIEKSNRSETTDLSSLKKVQKKSHTRGTGSEERLE